MNEKCPVPFTPLSNLRFQHCILRSLANHTHYWRGSQCSKLHFPVFSVLYHFQCFLLKISLVLKALLNFFSESPFPYINLHHILYIFHGTYGGVIPLNCRNLCKYCTLPVLFYCCFVFLIRLFQKIYRVFI